MKRHLVSLLAVCTIMISCFFSQQCLAETLAFRPQWAPQSQFSGFYAAAEKGFYAQEGIDLEIKGGGPGIDALDEVAGGKSTFATGWLISAMKVKASGKEIVNICQLIQKSALVLVARKDSGIKTVDDLAGKSIGIWPGDFQVPPRTLSSMKNIEVSFVDQGFSLDAFVQGEMDVCSAMAYNELLVLLDRHFKYDDLTVLSYHDVGMNFPEDGIYVSRSFLENHPEACAAFVRATIKGWKYAFANPDEIARLITDKANQTEFKTTFAHQKAMLQAMEGLLTFRVGPDGIGDLLKKDFDFVYMVLDHSRQIDNPFTYEDFFKKVR